MALNQKPQLASQPGAAHVHPHLYHLPGSQPQQRTTDTTPRSTPFQPQLYISTEHRPVIHRADSYQQHLHRQRTASNSEATTPRDEQEQFSSYDSESESEDEEVDYTKEEDAEDYRYGGYHPVQLGERFGAHKQYVVVRKLGWGHFSTVWLAFDEVSHQHVAVKVVRSDANYTQAALDEVKILEIAGKTNPNHPGFNHLVKMFDWFYHEGPNGKHVCMVFEVLGQSTLGLIDECKKYKQQHSKDVMSLFALEKSYGGIPLSITKKITKQLLLALDYLHRECGLIHTDIKPENILVEIKDVEKFVRCLKCSSATKKQRGSSSSTSSVNSLNSRARSSKRKTSTSKHQDSPIRCSKPLPSPITASTQFDFKDYFSSNYSLSTPSTPTIPSHQSHSQGSVNYYEDSHDPHDRLPSTSNSTSPQTQQQPQQSSLLSSFVVSASEANSDEEDEDDDTGYTTELEPALENTPLTSFSRPALAHLDSRLSSISLEDADDVASFINIKLADLGNACHYNLHYTNDIQTRHYRSPEVLLGHKWGASTDIWSVACVVFELLTSDYLFDPKNGSKYKKDDDHIAQIMELLYIDDAERYRWSKFVKESKYADEYFHSDGFRLRRIDKMKYWGLPDVLEQKYKMDAGLADDVAAFLLPMLAYNPKNRVDAGGWSNHPWLADVKCNDAKIDRAVGTRGEDIRGWTRTYHKSQDQKREEKPLQKSTL